MKRPAIFVPTNASDSAVEFIDQLVTSFLALKSPPIFKPEKPVFRPVELTYMPTLLNALILFWLFEITAAVNPFPNPSYIHSGGLALFDSTQSLALNKV